MGMAGVVKREVWPGTSQASLCCVVDRGSVALPWCLLLYHFHDRMEHAEATQMYGLAYSSLVENLVLVSKG